MIRFEDAIDKLFPNTEWVCYGSTLEGLRFIDENIIKPTQKEIDDAIKELETDRLTEAQAKQAKLDSAKAKLAALGLDEEEIAAIVGGI